MTEPVTHQPSQEAPGAPTVDWEKRYKDLQSYSDKTIGSLRSENDNLRKQSTVFVPPKTPEELEAFKRENPDWMGVIETVASQIATNSLAPLQEDLNRSKADKAAAEIKAAHPDILDIVQSDVFKQWAEDQGPEIQSWLNEQYDSSKVIRALNYFKAMNGRQETATVRTQEPTPGAMAVATHGSVVTPQTEVQPRRFSRAAIAKMHPAEYERNYEAIKFAAQNGLLTP